MENVVRLVESGFKAFKNKEICCAAFLDIDRAFDALWMAGIIKKLKDLKYPKNLISFIASFLKDRLLRVKHGCIKSSWIKMMAGTPQGAILSPDLFLVFTADIPLPDKKKECSSLYADDSATWIIAKDLIAAQRGLQTTMLKLGKWSTKWRLMPAPAKSSIVVFSRQTSINRIDELLQVTLLGERIPVQREAKFLGTILDRRLSWGSQFEDMFKRGMQKVFLIRRLTKHLTEPSNTPMQLFDSLVTSIFEYNAIPIVSANASLWRKVKQFEERAYRMIFGIAAGTNGQRVVDELVGKRLQDKLRGKVLKRIKSMSSTNALIQDLIMDHRDNIDRRHTSPIDEILDMAGIDPSRDCILCKCGVKHSCVKNRRQ